MKTDKQAYYIQILLANKLDECKRKCVEIVDKNIKTL